MQRRRNGGRPRLGGRNARAPGRLEQRTVSQPRAASAFLGGTCPTPPCCEGLSAGSADTRRAVLDRLLKLPGGPRPLLLPASTCQDLPPGLRHHPSCCSAICGMPPEMDGQTHATGWWHRFVSWASTRKRLDSTAQTLWRPKDSAPASWPWGHRLPVLTPGGGRPTEGPTCGHNTHFAGSL